MAEGCAGGTCECSDSGREKVWPDSRMWKKEEDDDCELAEAGGGSAASDDKDVDGRET